MKSEYCEGKVHIIERGDTLYQLSRKYNVPLALILRANPFMDVYNLQVGDEICIPVQIGMRPERPGNTENETNMRRPANDGNNMNMRRPANDENNMNMGRPENNESRNRTEFLNNRVNDRRVEIPEEMEDNVEEIEDEIELEQPENRNSTSTRPVTLPNYPNLFSYVVEEGESLEDILDNFDINLEDLLNFNDLDEMMLLPGSVVKVPIRKENRRS